MEFGFNVLIWFLSAAASSFLGIPSRHDHAMGMLEREGEEGGRVAIVTARVGMGHSHFNSSSSQM